MTQARSESRVAVPACGLPAPVAGGEWRDLVEKHKEHYFREEREDRRCYNTGYGVPAAVAMAAAMGGAAAVAVAAAGRAARRLGQGHRTHSCRRGARR